METLEDELTAKNKPLRTESVVETRKEGGKGLRATPFHQAVPQEIWGCLGGM